MSREGVGRGKGWGKEGAEWGEGIRGVVRKGLRSG